MDRENRVFTVSPNSALMALGIAWFANAVSGFREVLKQGALRSRNKKFRRHPCLQAGIFRMVPPVPTASTSTVATNQELAALRHGDRIRGNEHDLTSEHWRGARIEGAQAHVGRRTLANMIDVLRPDTRFDDELFLRRDNVE